MHSGLAGGIRAANDVHRFALASHRFGGSSAVIHARALQVVNPRNVQGSPLNTHRQEESVTGDLRTIGEFQKPVRALNTNADRFLRRDNLNTETPRLRYGTAGQVKAGESGRKAEIVLDTRTQTRLASR